MSEKAVKLFVNYTYKIESIYTLKINKKTEKIFKLKDESDGSIQNINAKIIQNHFKLPYASTCHSVQGLSINHPITIFDTNVHDRNSIWTAITRATD